MSLAEIKVVIFDVDKTLSDEVSWLKLTEGLGADPAEHEEIFTQFKERKLSYPVAKAKLVSLWQQTGKANLADIKKLFWSWKLKPDALETITYLQQKYAVILISGAVDTYVEVVAEKLGISHWYANTVLKYDSEGLLIDFDYHRDQAKKKVAQLEYFLSKYSLTKDQCLAVGDGDNDVELFRILPYSIAVNKEPHPELEKLAWKKVTALSEIQELI